MAQIIIKTQAEYNALPESFDEYTVVKLEGGCSIFSTPKNAHVEARESAHVVARDSAHVEAWGSAHVEAWGSAHVEAWDSAHVVAWGSAHVVARESAHVEAWGSAHIVVLSIPVPAKGSLGLWEWHGDAVPA